MSPIVHERGKTWFIVAGAPIFLPGERVRIKGSVYEVVSVSSQTREKTTYTVVPVHEGPKTWRTRLGSFRDRLRALLNTRVL